MNRFGTVNHLPFGPIDPSISSLPLPLRLFAYFCDGVEQHFATSLSEFLNTIPQPTFIPADWNVHVLTQPQNVLYALQYYIHHDFIPNIPIRTFIEQHVAPYRVMLPEKYHSVLNLCYAAGHGPADALPTESISQAPTLPTGYIAATSAGAPAPPPITQAPAPAPITQASAPAPLPVTISEIEPAPEHEQPGYVPPGMTTAIQSTTPISYTPIQSAPFTFTFRPSPGAPFSLISLPLTTPSLPNFGRENPFTFMPAANTSSSSGGPSTGQTSAWLRAVEASMGPIPSVRAPDLLHVQMRPSNTNIPITTNTYDIPFVPTSLALPFAPIAGHTHTAPATTIVSVAHNHILPPVFVGYLNKDVPDLTAWYRKIEAHQRRCQEPMLEVLDMFTSRDANKFIEQLIRLNIHDHSTIKSHFFTHYSYLLKDKVEERFNDLLFGAGIKMKTFDTMDSFIAKFRLAMSDAGINEAELVPPHGTSMIRTLTALFTRSVPEPIARELNSGDSQGNPFTCLQDLYKAALRAFKKRRHELTKSSAADTSKRQKTFNSAATYHSDCPPHLQDKTITKPGPSQQPPQQAKPAARAQSTLNPLSKPFQPAGHKQQQQQQHAQQQRMHKQPISSVQQFDSQPKPKCPPGIDASLRPAWTKLNTELYDKGTNIPPVLRNTPREGEPFAACTQRNTNITASHLPYTVVKALVGSARWGKARQQRRCVFCWEQFDAHPTSVHFAECPHRPF